MNQERTAAVHFLSAPGLRKDEFHGPGAEKTPFPEE
jgi:hypothetical protein